MREDTYEVSVWVEGKFYGIWDKWAGGGTTSAELKYKPGGMRPTRSLGGQKSVENVTLSRLYDEEVIAFEAEMTELVGAGRARASKQALTPRGAPLGSPRVINGTLQAVTPPDHDSESEDAGLIEIVISTDGQVGF